ncbi:MAG: hypothetical protein A3C93_03460 [Candidatus Lloydbacteria bacterium RIFCSPHIGHO2_02_FULL_54_17]|uniref:Translation elongation factor EFTu-like domain-containing protein n=1 Tax=Candidatus Lloydbacteria bacterium RIFCSPHIGHO2_02_FULL_54_17 TaxID=1798664 RepID=A0A1G2DFB7_9BACT|nr:MAG: hypothetical protein A2762_01075 [Candidatus Lloydbacteria bacterium RIFCSPHIGHO2_01_FULL_54_11]OGZ12344.1 MAG: hypothetical protein A3C93_03460 [Candidatus Lloydbacteria bacterium RIFCSPHIGHO2_02_FULL_54_17]OGZ14485.1 MAG: hypothetical protein A3H76_06000 [Candidatus Lloydbacteria bacterium RIFCSPLOWO2_02_FULL_54_12]OGZ14563.1 MAG: hypothetical protein A2948_05660 [Candidatus Lloydbacteria bacterium RIFCSPLOWO2_01_FULL_54_18]
MQSTIEVKDVFDIAGRGTVVVGTLRSGTLHVGMHTIVNGVDGKIAGIEAKGAELTIVGSEAGVLIHGLDKKQFSRGMLVYFS